jgi:hypothetical protein
MGTPSVIANPVFELATVACAPVPVLWRQALQQDLPVEDPPAAFSEWPEHERHSLIDRLQSLIDGNDAQTTTPRVLRSAADAYLQLQARSKGGTPHTGNQLMPSQTKAHVHPLANLGLAAEAFGLGWLFAKFVVQPVTLRGRLAHFLAGPDREEFGTFLQASPSSSVEYFEHE